MRIFRKKAVKSSVVVKGENDSLARNILSDKNGTVWVKNKSGIYKTGSTIEKSGKKS
jgi:hypothetical protein